VTSSDRRSPTSATHSAPVARSKLKRHGLRRPKTGDLAATAARGEGVVAGDAVRGVGLRRRVDAEDLAEQGGRCPAPGRRGRRRSPPSPRPIQSSPSGPNTMWPPLWFEKGWSWVRTSGRLAASTPSGVTRHSWSRLSPSWSV
jgi:hypothetical protein